MQISSDLGHILFLIFIYTCFFSIGFIFTVGPILATLTPRKLLKAYFKEPHFSQLELGFMSGIPGAYFRMLVFAWTVTRPTKSHVKRNIADCQKAIPKWYLYSLKSFTMISVISFSIPLGILAFLLLSYLLFRPPVDA